MIGNYPQIGGFLRLISYHCREFWGNLKLFEQEQKELINLKNLYSPGTLSKALLRL
jgi:hypothetical protein